MGMHLKKIRLKSFKLRLKWENIIYALYLKPLIIGIIIHSKMIGNVIIITFLGIQ